METTSDDNHPNQRKTERNVFLLLTVVLAPVLAVAIVGGYGFIIWIYQMFAGPPTA
ncbi:periplasmic nitrate reductase, NapE protein [Granulosicoccus sp. 3-233]|uniref:periplasmic nitrate reductase, NapE protein n=1 Tax=Granulosicoccus sp. 3-233 TaxID=3417969 RepID=UPI003D32F2B2